MLAKIERKRRAKVNRPGFANLFLVFSLVLVPCAAYCSNILGVVSDPDGKPVNGARISVTDANGQVATQGRTDLYGRYCLRNIEPGTYTLNLDPQNTDILAGSGVAKLELEGLTVNWGAAKDKPAVASATPGVASKAAVTCAGAWWDDPGVTATAGTFVTGGGVTAALFGTGVLGGGGTPPASSAR
jgi:hypothetical protein